MILEHLTIYTNQLSQQRQFYGETLGLPVHSESAADVTFLIGRSLLSLKTDPKAQPGHFAINIPSHAEEEALRWLKSRVAILKDHGREIQDFVSWNARSVYFYDPEHNIVELIARKNLEYPQEGPFGAASFLEISEIGMATEDIEALYTPLHARVGLDIYDGDCKRFCAIGDEQGLIICINSKEKTWYPSGDTAQPARFQLQLVHAGKAHTLSYDGRQLQIVSHHA